MDIAKHVFVGSMSRNNDGGHSVMSFVCGETLKYLYQLVDTLESGQDVYLIYEVDAFPETTSSDVLRNLVKCSPEVAVALKTSKAYFDSASYQVIKRVTSEEVNEEWIPMI